MGENIDHSLVRYDRYAIQLPTECNFELRNDTTRVIHRGQKCTHREIVLHRCILRV